MRRVTLETLATRDDAWLERSVSPAPRINRALCRFHVAEDEINHRGQIRWLRARLPTREMSDLTPTDMPPVFSYGTLQQDNVQLTTFGRRLHGQRDELPGFELSLVPIDDPPLGASLGRTHHANVVANGRPDSRVSGTVFEITDAELASADEYERVASYIRIAVTLASGTEAWVYVDARSVTGRESP